MTKTTVFDCVLYDGEVDVLAIRLNELAAVVDVFVIVEGALTFSGLPREVAFDPAHPLIAPFAARCRHMVVVDFPDGVSARDREAWQRNAVLRGIPDAKPDDMVIMADVDEIPRAEVITRIVQDEKHNHFGLVQSFSCFFVDWWNNAGPEAASVCAIAARRHQICTIAPDALRHGIRKHQITSCLIEDAGWHFSYLMDLPRLHQRIKSLSRQELDNPPFLDAADIAAMVRRGGDPFGRPGYVWARRDVASLPVWLRQNRKTLQRLFLPRSWIQRVTDRLRSRKVDPVVRRPESAPVVICPYVYERELEEVHEKFSLHQGSKAKLDFYIWLDVERLGPERAMQRCWEQFPERDVIIIHTDMAPWPDDPPYLWFETLCNYRDRLPQAGMLAANLYYPTKDGKKAHLQHGGGSYFNGVVDHLKGEVGGNSVEGGVDAHVLERVRPVDWVNFGGVLIRRSVIDACGGFDPRFTWAYFMDVDYCLEARLRGFRLFQVPCRLQHEESRTTRRMWHETPELYGHISDNETKFKNKWRQFAAALPSVIAENGRSLQHDSNSSSVSGDLELGKALPAPIR